MTSVKSRSNCDLVLKMKTNKDLEDNPQFMFRIPNSYLIYQNLILATLAGIGVIIAGIITLTEFGQNRDGTSEQATFYGYEITRGAMLGMSLIIQGLILIWIFWYGYFAIAEMKNRRF